MRDAMHNAVVGDDVLQDDPTVIKLEQMIADMCGKDAALFVPSGTMSNAVAIRAHTSPGDEIILSALAIFTSMKAEVMQLCLAYQSH